MTFLHVVAIEFLDIINHLFQQFVFNILMHHEIIGSDTGLASVYRLSPDYSSRRKIYVRVFIDDARTLTSKFQNQWREIFRSCLHHDSAHIRTSRIKNEIELLCQQSLIYVSMTLNHRDIILIEGLVYHFLHHIRSVLRIRRRL